MGTTNFLLDQLVRSNFSSTSGSTSSTGVAYDLISEGPIELVGGLSGVFLNRTPISNESVSSIVQAPEVPVAITGTAPFNITVYATLPAGVTLPVIVIDGLAESTVSSFTSETIITTGNFFNSSMVNGNSGDGTLIPKLRIKNANSDGTDYVGSVVSISSNTATVSPPITGPAAGKRINFDLFTTGVSSLNINEEFSSFSSNLQITSIPNATNIVNRFSANGLNGRLLFDSLSDNLPGSSSDKKNFKYAMVNFRSGTADQLPVKNLPSFTSASLGFTKNEEIKQHTDYVGFPTKVNQYWGKNPLRYPTGSTPIGGGTVEILASQVSPGSAGEVDELLLTISAPNGLYGLNEEGDTYTWGATFQIFFRYTSGGTEKEELIFGPTNAFINSARALIAGHQGSFVKNGPDPTGTIRAASKNSLDFDFRWSVEQYKPFTDFRVIVKKITPDALEYNRTDTIVANTTVKALQAFINDKLSYPHSAYAAIAFDSLEFAGNFPERAYRCRGVRTELPTNYVTREEASDGIAKYYRNSSGAVTTSYQIWDGTFRTGYSDNPIWNLREMLLNKRWGLGHWIDPSLINNYSFYSLARYCDELVPDGKGGSEPRFTCGVYLTEPVEAYKIIRDFCTMVLSIPYWVDGQMIIEADRPAEPVYNFTKGNIEGGIFSYEGTGNKTRPNQIAVRFNNKENFYEQDLELVDDVEDMVKQNRIFTEEVIAFGATTRGQATRYGKWKLLTSKLQKEVVSFKTGENGAYLKPGSIVNIQDADRNSVRYSGRLVSATTTTVVLDSPVSLPAGDQYTLHVFIPGSAVYLVQDSATLNVTETINGVSTTSNKPYNRGDLLPLIIAGVTVDTEKEASEIKDTAGNSVDVQFVEDAHIESKPISNILPHFNEALTLTENFTSAPAAETVWAITVKRGGSLVAGSAKQYKILSIGEESPGLYNITAAEHFNSKFDLIDEEFLATSPRTLPRYEELPPIPEFTANVFSNRGISDSLSNSLFFGIELNWVGPRAYVNNISSLDPRVDKYTLEIKDPTNAITIQELNGSDTTYRINNAIEGRYEFTLRAKSTLGPVSPPSRVNITVDSPSSKSSNLVATLPRGGTFNKPVNVGLSAIIAPSSYRFTAESGVSVIYSPSAPRVTPGTYWSNGTGVFLWNGTEWDVISGTFPNGLFSTLDSFTLSAFGSVDGVTAGNLSSTLGNVTVSGTGNFVIGAISGSLSSTLNPITVSGTGSFVASGISGNLSSTLGGVTLSGTGSFVPAAISGSLSSTLGGVTVSGTGNIGGAISGSLSSTLGGVTVSGVGSFVPAAISGSLSSTLDPITVSGTGDFINIVYNVTVANGTNEYGTGNKYYIDGSVSPTLNLIEGNTYRFVQSDGSNSSHPLRFSTTPNGTHGGGVEYTTGVTTVGTAGQTGAYTQITVAIGAPTLYYYCVIHSGMGGTASTPGVGDVSGNLSSTLGNVTLSGTGSVAGGAGTYMTVNATGATVTQDGTDDVYTFNGSGSFNVTALGSDPTFGNKAEYLVIAGGGGGGSRRGGGGGAGGYRSNRPGNASGGGASAESAMTLTTQSYSVVVGGGGAGGANAASAVTGAKGSDSSVFGIISEGGGGGGRELPLAGGSGGGASDGFMGPSTPTANQGFPGWVDNDNGWDGGRYTAGGGGGAGEAGLGGDLGPEGVRNGGNGVASTITGTSIIRAGGGGGGLSTPGQSNTVYNGTLTPGGAGGGGSGGAAYPDLAVRGGTGTPGTTNTGGGGGGGGQNGQNDLSIGHGAAGGSGVVIIRVRQR